MNLMSYIKLFCFEIEADTKLVTKSSHFIEEYDDYHFNVVLKYRVVMFQ